MNGHNVKLPAWRRALLRLFRVRVQHTRRVTSALEARPVILTCNHLSMLDGILIALASPRPLVFAVNVGHARQHPVISKLLAGLAAMGLGRIVAVDSTRPLAARALLQALRQGASVAIFPEGRISPDGRPLEPMPGVEWLAKRAGVPVLALRLRGAHRSRWFGKAGSDTWPRIWLRF